MNIVINNNYKDFSEIISSIPNYSGVPVDIIKNERNIIVRLNIDGFDCVVKKFRKPLLFNRLMYTFFRKSKPRRAYENAVKLQEYGIETNSPVAYMEYSSGGLFDTGYFVYKWLPYPILDDLPKHNEAERKEILDDLVLFMHNMLESGVFFLDINSANIMYYKQNDKWNFALLDINRMSFKNRPLSKKETLSVFKHCTLTPENLAYFMEKYAKLHGWDYRVFIGRVFLKIGINLPVRFRIFIKRILGKDKKK